jgi:fido (protein-threonine AMPylation protein)
MRARPSKRPGQLKVDANRAGSYEFVSPAHVRGTLLRGFDILTGLTDPFDRAVLAMFVVSEVHPFDDGNGRVARLAMNAELTAASRPRIIVPTVFRNEYLSALRQMSRERRTGLLARTLHRTWRWSAEMDFSDQVIARHWMAQTNALTDSTDAERHGIQLRLPSEITLSSA